MSTEWEDRFSAWAQGPSQTEQDRIDNAVRGIQAAIRDNDTLSSMSIKVFPQGSYRSLTNVRNDSDVDVCVQLTDVFFYELPTTPPRNPSDFAITEGGIAYPEFKNLVETALVNKFGRQRVTRGNKAFDVHENTYAIDADVVPAFGHRRYTDTINPDGTHFYHEGIEFKPDNGGQVINWPDQTYENGVSKNSTTNRRYKSAIRILKRLRNEMQENHITASNNVASFLAECLVWNVPDEGFAHQAYYDNVRHILAHTFNSTRNYELCQEWGEVNELKYLFRQGQPWTMARANLFLSAAWDYIGYQS